MKVNNVNQSDFKTYEQKKKEMETRKETGTVKKPQISCYLLNYVVVVQNL